MATAKKTAVKRVPVNAVQGNGDIRYLNIHVKDARTRDILVDGKNYSFVSINKLPFSKQIPILELQSKVQDLGEESGAEMVNAVVELFTYSLGEDAYTELAEVLSMQDLMELFQVLMSGSIPSVEEEEEVDDEEVTTEKK